MDAGRFDTLTKSLTGTSRRAVLAGVIGGLISTFPLSDAVEHAAAKKGDKKGKQKRTWTFLVREMDYRVEKQGDPAGKGSATIEIKRNRRGHYKVCGVFHYNGSYNSVWALIQAGKPSGQPQTWVDFGSITLGLPSCEYRYPRDKAHEIIRDPDVFYANILTDKYPKGAVAGQLEKI